MTVQHVDRDAVAHGKITEKPLREKPKVPTWAIKLGMAVTGLIFAMFVFVHMAGNLKVFMPMEDNGVRAIDEYGEWLRTLLEPLMPREGVLWIFRLVLLAAILIHVLGAFAITKRSKVSRGKFRRTNLIGGLDSFAARTMLYTGIILLAFIIFHILDLTVGLQPFAPEAFEHGAIYANMIATFSRWPVTIFYIIAMLALFLHLTHGIWLATSDLGITGRRWRAVMLFIAYLLPALVLIGNIAIPLSIATGLIS